jgi:hypothetical protein
MGMPYDAERVGLLCGMLREARKRKLSAGLKARLEAMSETHLSDAPEAPPDRPRLRDGQGPPRLGCLQRRVGAAVPNVSADVAGGRRRGHRMRPRFADSIRASSRFGLHQQVRTHDCKRPLCGTPNYLLPGGGHPHMKRREFIACRGPSGIRPARFGCRRTPLPSGRHP